MNDATTPLPDDDSQRAERLEHSYAATMEQIGRRIVGQRAVIDEVLSDPGAL